MLVQRHQFASPRRRGAVAALVAISLVTLLGMAALTVDVGMMYRARAEVQQAADAAALAGAWELLSKNHLNGTPVTTEQRIALARAAAANYAFMNPVINAGPTVRENAGNDTSGDIVVGYLLNPDNPGENMTFVSPDNYNSVQVRVSRNDEINGPVGLYFAAVFGKSSTDVAARATASFRDGVNGYRVTPETGNADLLPLALHVDVWEALLAGTLTVGDDFSYNVDTDSVTSGSDGVLELNLFPGNGVGQLPPGNFGTVNIGPPNNSTAVLSRQIREGVSASDLAYYGGELVFNEDGTILLTGDTGLSGAIKDDLISIIGKPRAIPLFNKVEGPGNNAVFTIVGFAGIRVLDVVLTGSMTYKRVVIQPAIVVDDAVVAGPGEYSNYFVYQPVRLVR